MSATAFRRLLEEGDVQALRSAWTKVASHLPQPETYEKAEIVMHMTRTASASVRFRFRAYSHRWLTEHVLPSQLPDELRPRAERLYPVTVHAVGISVSTRNPYLAPVVGEVRHAMELAVLDADAEGRIEDTAFVTARMKEARSLTYKKILGVAYGEF